MSINLPVAVITGASSGIGAASARALSRAGYDVVVGARRIGRLEEVAAECGGVAMELDVTDQDSVNEFAARIDRCDVLVNGAGGALGAESVLEASVDDWQWMYDTNVLGTLRVTQALLPQLIDSGDGQIINIGSMWGKVGASCEVPYSAAKAGVKPA